MAASQLMSAIEMALLDEQKKIYHNGFQAGVERGRFEQRWDDRPKFDRLAALEKMVERAHKFVVEQERKNHEEHCPGYRGWKDLCFCPARGRMSDFFDIMGDLFCAVEEGKKPLVRKPDTDVEV